MMLLCVDCGHMDNVIARPRGMELRSSFFKNGTNEAMIDKTLSANADKKEKKNSKLLLKGLCTYSSILVAFFQKISFSSKGIYYITFKFHVYIAM